ncbi:hypothetical protein PV797_08950 [Clostridiaceae bacterium M8S5]|nr:hypothetical protein PV797_08950 [Clostridiaceae bacterium M8S5]
MIQIDDAGSGSLIGGTCIGMIRVETGEFEYGFIPIKYYMGDMFNKKEYLNYVIHIVEDMFNKLNVTKEEIIDVCRGYMFDNLRKWMKKNQYTYNSVKIGEPLQSKIEKAFEDYTISLGLPRAFITYTKYPFHFHRLLRWVYADFDNRSLLCKTGWKSWNKYNHMDKEVSIVQLKKSNYICYKCGKKIKDNTKVKKITYKGSKDTTIYLHENC